MKTLWTVFIQRVNFCPEKTTKQGADVAKLKRESGVSKALNAAWLRPFLFLLFIVVAWDLTIRVFRIPAYQIPAPGDVVAGLWARLAGTPPGAWAAPLPPLFRLPRSRRFWPS